MPTTLALPSPGFVSPLAAQLRREPLLSGLGLALLAAVPPTLLALALDGRTLGGVPVLLKPLKFQLSLGLHMLTLALALGALDPAVRRGRMARWAVAAVLTATIFEAGWITFQGARGLPSHFAQTPFGAVMYALMGAFATVLVAATSVLGLLLLRAPRRAGVEPVLARAAGLGLLVSGLAGLVTGWAISLHGASAVGVVPPGSPVVPLFGWSGVAGDLRAAHFVGLHAAQVLPLLGLMLRGRDGAPRGVLTGAALLWSALTLGAMLQALAGLPAIPLGG